MSVTAPEMGPQPMENSGAGPLRLMRGPTIPTLGINRVVYPFPAHRSCT
jgi:hypothetical protein